MERVIVIVPPIKDSGLKRQTWVGFGTISRRIGKTLTLWAVTYTPHLVPNSMALPGTVALPVAALGLLLLQLRSFLKSISASGAYFPRRSKYLYSRYIKLQSKDVGVAFSFRYVPC